MGIPHAVIPLHCNLQRVGPRGEFGPGQENFNSIDWINHWVIYLWLMKHHSRWRLPPNRVSRGEVGVTSIVGVV